MARYNVEFVVAVCTLIATLILNGGLLWATLQASRAAKLSADIAAKELRATRIPLVDVTWQADYEGAALRLRGSVRTATGAPMLVRQMTGNAQRLLPETTTRAEQLFSIEGAELISGDHHYVIDRLVPNLGVRTNLDAADLPSVIIHTRVVFSAAAIDVEDTHAWDFLSGVYFSDSGPSVRPLSRFPLDAPDPAQSRLSRAVAAFRDWKKEMA